MFLISSFSFPKPGALSCQNDRVLKRKLNIFQTFCVNGLCRLNNNSYQISQLSRQNLKNNTIYHILNIMMNIVFIAMPFTCVHFTQSQNPNQIQLNVARDWYNLIWCTDSPVQLARVPWPKSEQPLNHCFPRMSWASGKSLSLQVKQNCGFQFLPGSQLWLESGYFLRFIGHSGMLGSSQHDSLIMFCLSV